MVVSLLSHDNTTGLEIDLAALDPLHVRILRVVDVVTLTQISVFVVGRTRLETLVANRVVSTNIQNENDVTICYLLTNETEDLREWLFATKNIQQD